eukprot:TRINITY_DN601_c0_g1_i1.p1 TRINITY_DN601_c0_g1~~TRINITY_DN601_c0_g1_i1.p1  ORF type:complete len:199 (+),score=33.77 TRINITY_DN601_c0_g1_i1:39-635(+)
MATFLRQSHFVGSTLKASTGIIERKRLLFQLSRAHHHSEFSLRSAVLSTCSSPLHPQIRSRTTMAARDEEAAAAAAAETADTSAPTIFDKIAKKEIPSTIVFEDEKVMAFRDVNPQAPVHIVLIPKERDGLTQLCKAEERHASILGHLFLTAAKVARQEGLSSDGYRVVVNDGPNGCQSVYHLHLHIIGGRQMKWPPG